MRLKLAESPNNVTHEAFYKDAAKQTTMLVLEALNGMTLEEFLSAGCGFDNDQQLLVSDFDESCQETQDSEANSVNDEHEE